MALPILRLPISSNVVIKQGDTIPKLSCAFDSEDDIDLTGSTIKVQLSLGGIIVYTATTGSGVTLIDTKTFEIDKIVQSNPFPVGVLKGDLQITDASSNTTTYFNIEVTITEQYTA